MNGCACTAAMDPFPFKCIKDRYNLQQFKGNTKEFLTIVNIVFTAHSLPVVIRFF